MKNQYKHYLQLISFFLFSSSPLLYAHGVLESPASREQFCGVVTKPDEVYQNQMSNEKCRPIMKKQDGSLDNSIYNFMAVLTHTVGRSDKPISELPQNVCGFNSENWGKDKTPWDTPMDWPTVLINSGRQNFVWNINWGNHFSDTEEFVYWITKPDFKFDPNKALTWNDFEDTPFCKLKYDDKNPNANPDIIPDKSKNLFTTVCEVPKRDNRSVIYAEWGRNKATYERFHACVDVVFNNSNSTPAILIKAKMNPISAKVTGQTQIELDGSSSIGSNLSYIWSIDADNLAPYHIRDSQSAKTILSIDDTDALQNVMINLTVKTGNAVANTSQQFTHIPSVGAKWQLVGDASVDMSLKSGDKLQLRLVDNQGKDNFIPSTAVTLDDESAKPENWAYKLADSVNSKNSFLARIGVLSDSKNTIDPVKSADNNKIYVPATSTIKNGYIKVIPGGSSNETCTVKRQNGSNAYWMGYDIFIDKAPVILDFSDTGIDLTKIMIDKGVFSDVKVLDKDKLLINKKPDWVTKTTSGYMGFNGPQHGRYDAFEKDVTAKCETQN